ncbi:hypothetical protein TRFO_22087 [Tritrichomonas foetus]|uniref:Uncharacterized protein n=1 Tax=Tritrichomonas foetus TaxID=1144522 RepID=A0A1J4KH57_9EUKA|nr:hypothetical protein TRFO_22087 [Tritrichomonas foetus]|eukprot:OHT09164.1 hypothetical protein TRFO_22087 [Tritrichomonas foetus]
MSQNQMFTLTINNRPYQFKAKTFAKVSKRAGQLIKTGIYEDSIKKELTRDAVEAFVAACNLQQFKVTSTNAFELLDLAVDYKIANLEKFVNNYVRAKGIERPDSEDKTDYLQIFIDKMKNKELQIEDYVNVAKRFDKYVTDERMYTIHTLPLFRLILFTDYEEIDDIKLNAFVMKLLQEKPETAVPLLLRIDFSKLTRAQDSEVFNTPEVHDENINYFTAASLSADRNLYNRKLNGADKEIEKQANDLDIDMTNMRRDHVDELETAFQNEYKELKDFANQQRAQIDAIRSHLAQTKAMGDQIATQFENNAQNLIDETKRTKSEMQKSKEENDRHRERVLEEINRQVDAERARVLALIEETKENDTKRREAAENKKKNPYESLLRNIERMRKNCATLDQAVEASLDESDMVKATLAAKMVKDFMRFDNFIRRNEKRHKIFDRNDIWGLKSTDVKQAETDLAAIERRIDKLCPIRHTVTKDK